MKKRLLLAVLPMMLGLVSCGGTVYVKQQEIALGSSVLGNWGYQNAEGGNKTTNGAEVSVYVDSETKFHFTIGKQYKDYAESFFTFEGQITGVEKGVASCFPVFMNFYSNHGAVSEDATAAAKAQYSTYRTGLGDIFGGETQFQMTFHRLSADVMDNGFITIDNADFDITFGVFEAVDALSA
ncbi:MAG: hypothetical protein WCR56_04300 [Bacilli bacterium]